MSNYICIVKNSINNTYHINIINNLDQIVNNFDEEILYFTTLHNGKVKSIRFMLQNMIFSLITRIVKIQRQKSTVLNKSDLKKLKEIELQLKNEFFELILD